MRPSWYDLLGVDTDASAEEIRAAWKAAIADLDPTDRRFRVLNQAAEVLLDPTARAEYDAGACARAPTRQSPRTERRRSPRVGENLTTSAPRRLEPGDPTTAGHSCLAARRRWSRLTVYRGRSAPPPGWRASPRTTQSPTRPARHRPPPRAAAVTILAYDYRTMDEDQAAAGALMTADYREEYDKLFAVLKENAAGDQDRGHRGACVASGIVRAEARPGGGAGLREPAHPERALRSRRVYRDQVTLTMEKVDGDWLVDDLETTPPSAPDATPGSPARS